MFSHYLKSSLPFDVFVNFTLLFSDLKLASYWIGLLFFFKLRVFNALIKNLDQIVNLKQSIRNLLSLIKLLVLILFITHIFSCFWLFMGIQGESQREPKTWLGIR